MNKTVRIFLGLFLGAALVGCAAGPADGDEGDPANAPAAEASSDGEENVGTTQQEMKWTKPMCAYFTWKCGACICNACHVEDCRGVDFNDAPLVR